jgi:plasmid stabilization system protein ParE
MKVRFTPSSLAEIDKILTYIEDHSPQGAGNVQKRIREVISLLGAFPQMGLPARRANLRRFAVSPYPYVIFYQVTAREIIIRRIRHTSRRPV